MPEAQPIEARRPEDVARMEVTQIRVDESGNLDDVFSRVTELAATTLGVERVGIWLLVDEGRALRCTDLFELSTLTHSSGTMLIVDDFPEYFAALRRRKTVAAEVATTDPRTSALTDAYLIPLGVSSLLDAAIFVGGEVVGVLCHEHIGPAREWTTEARDFASSMADLIAKKMRVAEVHDLRNVLKSQTERIAEAKRLESIAQMAAGAAHDFNNVLSVVSGYAESISLEAGVSAATATAAEKIVEAAKHGAELVSELIAFAKPSRKDIRVVRPSEIVAEQLAFLQIAATAKCVVEADLRTDAARVLISPDQLRRVLANLVCNARDAMPEGGRIIISLEKSEADDDCGKRVRFAVLSVTDEGTGIPESVLGKIFDPFFTTKSADKGTGLGLAVVRQAVDQAGGFVRVESTLGRGTTFRLYLPLAGN